MRKYLVEMNSDSSLPILSEICPTLELALRISGITHTVVGDLLIVLDRHFVGMRSRIGGDEVVVAGRKCSQAFQNQSANPKRIEPLPAPQDHEKLVSKNGTQPHRFFGRPATSVRGNRTMAYAKLRHQLLSNRKSLSELVALTPYSLGIKTLSRNV